MTGSGFVLKMVTQSNPILIGWTGFHDHESLSVGKEPLRHDRIGFVRKCDAVHPILIGLDGIS